MTQTKKTRIDRKKCLAITRAWAMAIALASSAIWVMSPPAVHAQSTRGSIVGHAPAGDTIVVKGRGGVHRTTTVKESGRYVVRGLPLGAYSVVLFKDGNEMDTKYGVKLRPGGSFKVDFACKNDTCAKQDKSGSS